jgi:hypothetical protein
VTETITSEMITAQEFEGAGMDFMNCCYTCRCRGPVPGSRHSSCRGIEQQPAPASMKVSFDPHGVANGWPTEPFDFDPVWLRYRDAFKQRDT